MKKLLSVILAVIMAISCFAFGASAKDSKELKFSDDGKFRILNLCDIQDGPVMKSATKDFLKSAVAKCEPDLIILGGDNISGGQSFTKGLAKVAIGNFMKVFEEIGVPVAIVFGNHDSEGLATKEDMMKIYEQYDCFVGCEGEDLTGCGNYNLPIKSSDGRKVAFNLWLFDSLTYNDNINEEQYKENDLGGYGCVHKDQIDWYKRVSNELKEQNQGKPVPSMSFQHIIVPEIYDACPKGENGMATLPQGAEGKMGENPCPPQYNNGQFSAMLKQGDMVAMFFGHDHTNTFKVNYQGIDLVNTPGAGFGSYGDNDRGLRVIDINESNPWEYDTYLVTWREHFDADNDPLRFNQFIVCGNEFSFGEKFTAFFKYIFYTLFK